MKTHETHLAVKRLRFRLFAATALVNTVLLLVIAWFLWQSYLHAQQSAHEKVTTIARYQEQSLADTADKITLVLSTIQDEIAKGYAYGGINRKQMEKFLVNQRSSFPELATLLYINADGKVESGTETADLKSVALSDRGYFRYHQQNPDPKTKVFEPHLGRIAHEWVLPFSRRVTNSDGSFGGVVLATIRLSYIEWLFSVSNMGVNGLNELRYNKRLITRNLPQFGNQPPAVQDETTSTFESFIRGNQQYGTFMETSVLDDVERIVSIRKVGYFPLYIRVGLSKEEYLRGWYGQRLLASCVYAIFLLITLFLSLKLSRSWLRIREAEAEAHASHALLAKLSRNIVGVIYQFRLSPSGHFSLPYASEKFEEYFGVSKEAVCHDAAPGFENVHPDDIQGFMDSIQNSAHTMQPWEYEFRVTPAPGITRWLLGTSMPEKCEDGSILWYGFLGDITERKQTELEMQLAARVFSDTHEGIVITDANGMIVDVNEAFTRITGYSQKECVGQNTRILKSGHHPPEFYEEMWRVLIETGVWTGQIWNRNKNGEVYAGLLTINAVRGACGTIENFVAVHTDITSIKEQEQALKYLAHYDALTGVLNRTLLEDRLQQALAQSQRTKSSVAVAYIDLDGFKEINDRFGHPIGDELLVLITQRMKNALREVDFLIRMGGDEFLAILTGIDSPQDCERILDRMLQAIAEKAPVDSTVAQVSASIGVTIFPDLDQDIDVLVKHADQAMYNAKLAGKNRLCFFKADGST